ncbi:MAG: formimidoylglutamate deiminase [Pseudomonadota bacterium]|nr:formimidoylglutamate deiminase [Rubrivivax sp.]
MSGGAAKLLWAPAAWIEGRWHESVLLAADAAGCWSAIEPGRAAPPEASVLPGPVLPGLVNAHSHAFQRAFAGRAERRAGAHDDFWSWRERMYEVALAITPEQLRAVAARLYRELLAGGYTQVCEFHYLHHAADGRRCADPLALSRALAQAAADAGIGLTLLPALYERAGFAQAALRPEQRRFATTAAEVLELRAGIRGWRAPRVSAGVAIHSLRAAVPASMRALVEALDDDAAPIHIHIAEQTGEVDDCLAATGARPIEWLTRNFRLDARWQLVHATHASAAEIDAVAASGAGVVICPSTEANLGDGLPDLPRWLAAGVPLAIGSDSQVCRSAAPELRWLEYAQRLALRRRNVAADPLRFGGSSGARLFEACLSAGGAAAGLARWGLVAGARADLLVLDTAAAGLDGAALEDTLDAWIFATDAPAVAQTWVAGQRVH